MKKLTEEEIANLKRRLPEIETLAMLKMEKNFIALEKGYPRQPYADQNISTSYLISRIEDELKELKEHFSRHPPSIRDMMEECADISNIVDYLFEHLVRFEIQRLKNKAFGV